MKTCAGRKKKQSQPCNQTQDGEEVAYRRSVVHQKGTQSPGEPQTQQDVKDIAPNRVGHSHVPHAWRGARQAESKIDHQSGHWCDSQTVDGFVPCRATIRLAMQSGTLVPAARKVMPMM